MPKSPGRGRSLLGGSSKSIGALLLFALLALILLLLSPLDPTPPTDDPDNGGGPSNPGGPGNPGGPDKENDKYFRRIATFPVFENSDIDEETVSEIIAASEDGMTLVYTDASLEAVGFVDITDPVNPAALGILELPGEPTSVKVVGNYAIVCVNTSEDFVNTSGEMVVVDMTSLNILETLPLGGQPDAVAVSPDKAYAAIAIENERDEDLELTDGEPPQAPSGFLTIVDLAGTPDLWTTREVNFDGIPDLFPNDAEPEFVDINEDNLAVVTLQENNHIILVDLPSGNVVNDFSAGAVDLTQVDTNENDLIELTDDLYDIPREADAVAWIDNDRFVTADEGDLFGGSRGFTIYHKDGTVLFTSLQVDDHTMAMLGHYPESRSENKGNEPEGVAVAKYGKETLIFVGSERSSIVSVHTLEENSNTPEFKQALVGGLGPEGLLAIPSRNLFVTASEEDSRDDKFRSAVTIYKKDSEEPTYPTIASEDGPEGTPIPWAALSALAADSSDASQAWTVYDSYYKKSRIFSVDTSEMPALINAEIVLKDTYGVFAQAIADAILEATTSGTEYNAALEADLAAYNAELPEEDKLAFDDVFDIAIDDLINDDMTVNLDPEGLARRSDGGFWLASEGAGSFGDEGRAITSLDWLFQVDDSGNITEVVSLPQTTNAKQIRFGFEGVTSVGTGSSEVLYVCIQRKWAGESHPRIGRYDTQTGEWTFCYYELDTPTSPAGGWVGLSEIVAIDEDEFLVVERDNQANLDATIKKIYAFSTAGVTFKPDSLSSEFDVLSKTLKVDLIPALLGDNGFVIEKVEGLAVLANGKSIIVTDNDGVDDSSGETQFINLGKIH